MTYDAIIIGSGINGLACALYLARAGWRVLVLERNDVPGGALQTAELTLPGYRHDTFATNMSLFAGSTVNREFGADLARHGLEFDVAPHTFSSVFPDGSFAGVSTGLDETLATLHAICPPDASRWRELAAGFPARAERLFPLLNAPAPSRAMWRVLFSNLRTGGIDWLRDIYQLLLGTPRGFVERNFVDPRTQALAASWGMHLDFAPDIRGGAMFCYLECMANQAFGMAFARGGAGNVVKAMTALLEELGGELRLNSEVTAIRCHNGIVSELELASGERLDAGAAVIANLTPRPLFDRLLDPADLPAGFVARAANYRYGPGTMMIHCALDALPDWSAGPRLAEFAYVHIGPYVDDLARAYRESMAGLLPASPMLVVGQPSVVDPTRAPAGRHVLSIQVRSLPGQIQGDALNQITGFSWNEVGEAYADRVIDKIESYAPGLRAHILKRTVITPDDIAAANPNLVGGCNLGGSMHLSQNFFLRPFPGWSNYRTPVRNLYMVGAATWPGAGSGAGSGTLLGKQLAGP